MNAQTIVVGIDGSERTARALEWLAPMLKGSNADVVAVHCLRPWVEDLYALPPLNFDQWKSDTVEAFEKKWCAPLRDAGVPYRTRLVEFEPAEGLQRVGDQEDADVIVVGSHGHGRFGHHGVAHRLLHGTRAVLSVPSKAG